MHKRQVYKSNFEENVAELKRIGSFKDAHIKEENISQVIHGIIHILHVLKRLEDFPICT